MVKKKFNNNFDLFNCENLISQFLKLINFDPLFG